MKVFCHHAYEFKKGLRNLVLHTTRAEHRDAIEAKLEAEGIAHLVPPLRNGSIYVCFGNAVCMEVPRGIGAGNLSRGSDEEDFVLGIMLDYDRLQQCARYLKRRDREAIDELAG